MGDSTKAMPLDMKEIRAQYQQKPRINRRLDTKRGTGEDRRRSQNSRERGVFRRRNDGPHNFAQQERRRLAGRSTTRRSLHCRGCGELNSRPHMSGCSQCPMTRRRRLGPRDRSPKLIRAAQELNPKLYEQHAELALLPVEYSRSPTRVSETGSRSRSRATLKLHPIIEVSEEASSRMEPAHILISPTPEVKREEAQKKEPGFSKGDKVIVTKKGVYNGKTGTIKKRYNKSPRWKVEIDGVMFGGTGRSSHFKGSQLAKLKPTQVTQSRRLASTPTTKPSGTDYFNIYTIIVAALVVGCLLGEFFVQRWLVKPDQPIDERFERIRV